MRLLIVYTSAVGQIKPSVPIARNMALGEDLYLPSHSCPWPKPALAENGFRIATPVVSMTEGNPRSPECPCAGRHQAEPSGYPPG